MPADFEAAPLGFSHVGVWVRDLPRMVDFYCQVLGLAVSDRGITKTPAGEAEIAFLTANPLEHHQLVLIAGRPADAAFSTVNQISFRLAGIAQLRAVYEARRKDGQEGMMPAYHGNAMSVYFPDPEGNRLELFFDMPWHVIQPMRIAFDFARSDAELMRWAEGEAKKLPGFMPRAQWQAELAEKIRAGKTSAAPK